MAQPEKGNIPREELAAKKLLFCFSLFYSVGFDSTAMDKHVRGGYDLLQDVLSRPDSVPLLRIGCRRFGKWKKKI